MFFPLRWVLQVLVDASSPIPPPAPPHNPSPNAFRRGQSDLNYIDSPRLARAEKVHHAWTKSTASRRTGDVSG